MKRSFCFMGLGSLKADSWQELFSQVKQRAIELHDKAIPDKNEIQDKDFRNEIDVLLNYINDFIKMVEGWQLEFNQENFDRVDDLINIVFANIGYNQMVMYQLGAYEVSDWIDEQIKIGNLIPGEKFEEEKRKFDEKATESYLELHRERRDEIQTLKEKLNSQNTERKQIESSLIKIFEQSKGKNEKMNFSRASKKAKREFPNGIDGRKCDDKNMKTIYENYKQKGVIK